MFHRSNVTTSRNINYDQCHIYAGVFNIHLNNEDNLHTLTFSELMECFDLTNHVNFATHTSGNTVDLVISNNIDMIQHVEQDVSFQTI